VGDLEIETRVDVVGDGRCVATPSEAWKIWGPMGGYIAAIALRGAATAVDAPLVPASFSCQFMAAARFEPVEMAVAVRRASRRTALVAVSMTQDDAPILDGQVWFAVEAELLSHDHAGSSGAGRPEDHRPIQEITDEPSPFPFWDNLDGRPLDWVDDWESFPGAEPTWRQWLRFVPNATFDDPVVEACRLLVLADLPSWPAATRAHPGDTAFGRYVAPNLDLSVQFHRLSGLGEWLLCAGEAPVADRGLIGFRSTVWSTDDRLAASGAGQLLTRAIPPQPPA
jgi:acyl-CoA thioesterase